MATFINNHQLFDAVNRIRLCLLSVSALGGSAIRISINERRAALEIDRPLQCEQPLPSAKGVPEGYESAEIYGCAVIWKKNGE